MLYGFAWVEFITDESSLGSAALLAQRLNQTIVLQRDSSDAATLDERHCLKDVLYIVTTTNDAILSTL